MDVKDLRYFIAVYEAKGFSRAAVRLDTVQSNVSARIRNLEESLGVVLFERNPREIAPTAKGHKFYAHAQHVLATVEFTERLMRQEKAA